MHESFLLGKPYFKQYFQYFIDIKNYRSLPVIINLYNLGDRKFGLSCHKLKYRSSTDINFMALKGTITLVSFGIS